MVEGFGAQADVEGSVWGEPKRSGVDAHTYYSMPRTGQLDYVEKVKLISRTFEETVENGTQEEERSHSSKRIKEMGTKPGIFSPR